MPSSSMMYVCVFLWSLIQIFLFYSSAQQTTENSTVVMHMTSIVAERERACSGSDVSYIPAILCDGVQSCPLGDDEFLCDDKNTCSAKETLCKNSTRCVPLSAICNKSQECSDGSDEKYCDFASCDVACSSCSSSGATCDLKRMSVRRLLVLPAPCRFLTLVNVSDLTIGLPVSSNAHPFLSRLILSYNSISDLGIRIFENLTSLRTLDLSHNLIRHFDVETFKGLDYLLRLVLTSNQISRLGSEVFIHLQSLEYLYLDRNHLEEIHKGIFTNLSTLSWLELSDNLIASLNEGTFADLVNLKDLLLRRNSLSLIEVGAFRGLQKLTGISFTNNTITELRKGMLDGLSDVRWISFWRNPLLSIEPGTFDNTRNIETLLLSETHLDNLHPDMFRGLSKLKRLSTNDYRLCCLFANSSVCTTNMRSSLDSCDRLMPNDVLRVAMWILGFGALIGNSMVLVIRCCQRRARGGGHEQSLFIINLAIADWIMGVYMVIIASADAYFGKYYYLLAPKWRESILCKFAGFVAVLSSEGSVFLLAIITFDRFVSVMFPFSKFRFHTTSARICVAAMWFVTVCLSAGPIIVGLFVPTFYGLSDVCIGLPLSVESTANTILVYDKVQAVSVLETLDAGTQRPSWIYSIFLFLALNFFLFMFILICYILIFVHVKRSTMNIGAARHVNSSRDKEITMAIKMAIIIGTDFCCWMPVIIMGTLSQANLIKLPVSLYAWCAVFILPINASLNPYLYTMVNVIGTKRDRIKRRSVVTSFTVTGGMNTDNTKL